MPEPDLPDVPPVRRPPRKRVASQAPAEAAPVEVVAPAVEATDVSPVEAAVVEEAVVEEAVADQAPMTPAERTAVDREALLPAPSQRPKLRSRAGVAGLVLAVVALVGVGVVLTRAVPGDAGPQLAVGSCYDLGEGAVERAVSVDCAQPHELQVLSELAVDAEDFPGRSGLRQQADERCNVEAAAFMTGRSVPEGLGYGFVVPTEQSWERGDRTITCTLVSTTDERLTGSIG